MSHLRVDIGDITVPLVDFIGDLGERLAEAVQAGNVDGVTLHGEGYVAELSEPQGFIDVNAEAVQHADGVTLFFCLPEGCTLFDDPAGVGDMLKEHVEAFPAAGGGWSGIVDDWTLDFYRWALLAAPAPPAPAN